MNRQLSPGNDGVDPGQGPRLSGIDRNDPGMRMGTSEQLAPEHPGQHQVVGEESLSGTLGVGVYFRARGADYSRIAVPRAQ